MCKSFNADGLIQNNKNAHRISDEGNNKDALRISDEGKKKTASCPLPKNKTKRYMIDSNFFKKVLSTIAVKLM